MTTRYGITPFLTSAERLTELIQAVPDWSAPTPCDEWSGADVVNHLVSTQREFLAPFTSLPSDDVDASPPQRWRAHAEAVAGVLPAVAPTSYDGFFGPTTVGETMTTFYGFDQIVHRWDIARAAGLEEQLSEDELDQIEAALPTFGEQLYAEGICRPGVAAPEGADRQTRILALLGRRA